MISLATCPIYFRSQNFDFLAEVVDGRDEERDQARVVQRFVFLTFVPSAAKNVVNGQLVDRLFDLVRNEAQASLLQIFAFVRAALDLG